MIVTRGQANSTDMPPDQDVTYLSVNIRRGWNNKQSALAYRSEVSISTVKNRFVVLLAT